MRDIYKIKQDLADGVFEPVFENLYRADGQSSIIYAQRYLNLIERYEKIFPKTKEISLFSAPGRTEIGGNHTDHQHGCVLAASINLDIIAAASTNNENVIRVQSEGFPPDEVNLDNLEKNPEEYNQAKALIRGVAAGFKKLGYDIKGFNAYTSSNVLKGSGLSSSAAFEVLIGNIINTFFADNKVSAEEIAKIGQYAENNFFGKPCGLMDQMASSVGGIITIDFKDTENPVIKKNNFNFSEKGYSICIIDTGADHADLTDEYASIPYEMKLVAKQFGKDYLREIEKQEFIEKIPDIRPVTGDRAILRALHYFEETERALKEAEALENNNLKEFFNLIRESGESSYMYLQNVNVCGSSKKQPVGLALGLCNEFLKDTGAFRVHGGGFAGTVQAFVPTSMLYEFKEKTENILGKNTCHIISVRQAGGYCLTEETTND